MRKASRAPRLEAKLTMSKPQARPKMAPAASVMTAAPGNEKAVTVT